MKTYLVEEYSPEIAFEDNSLIIALTPKACYQLDKLGITYSIIEDYYSESELFNDDSFNFASQLTWIEDFDRYLQEKIPQLKKLNLKLCYWYFYFLKSTIDPLIVRSNTLNRFFERTKPSNVVYITADTEEIAPDFTLFFGKGKSIYLRILPLFCKKYSTSFTCINVAEEAMPAIGDTTSTDAGVTRKLKDFVGSHDALLSLYKSYRSGGWHNAVPHLSRHNQLNILMLKSGYGTDLFIRDALKRGHNVFLKSEDTLFKYTLFGLKKYYKLNNSDSKSFINPDYKESWQTAANQLINQPEILGWINNKCGVDVSDIILPRLQYFISSICPEILGYFNDFVNFYNKNDIDFVITPHEWLPDEVAAIAAARHSKNTKSVCFWHGICAYATDMLDITEIDHHDIYFAHNEEIVEYHIKRKGLFGGLRTEIVPGFGLYLFSNYIKIKENRQKRIAEKSKDKKTRPKIIYLPIFFMWDHRRIGHNIYSDTMYYTLQKALIELFATKKEFDFVWKGLPASDAVYNPIPDFIKDNQFENIEVATDYFGSHLISADRVIADTPSTGFYEAVIAGVPAMSLYHRNFKVRKSAIEFFGHQVQPFSDIPEALEKIDRFLENDPKLYCRYIPLTNNALKILEDLNQAKQDV
jgi:hypothetical protein